MTKLIGIISLIALASCHASKPVVTTDNTRTAHDSINYKETLRVDTVMIPGDSIIVRIPVNCDSGKMKPIYFKTDSKRSNLSVVSTPDGNLQVNCNCDPEKATIMARDIEINKLKTSAATIKTTVTVEVYKTHWYDIALRWYFFITLIIVLIYILIRRYLNKNILYVEH